MWASWNGDKNIAQILIEAGAEKDVLDEVGNRMIPSPCRNDGCMTNLRSYLESQLLTNNITIRIFFVLRK
jgi:hypothetical protein